MDDSSIGVRIRQFRGKALTQRQLADQAGVSVDLVRKLEQGGRQTASIASLQKIARALDVDIADLIGKRQGVPSTDPDAGIVAIRRALTPVDDLLGETKEEAAVSLDDGRRAVDYAWGAYWSGRYELLTSILPPGLTQLRATVHAARNGSVAPANELLARMYWVTGCTLVHLGQTDPAFLAIRQALTAAEMGNDPLLLATIRGSVAWQLLVQGRYDESRGVALNAAATLEPSGDVTPTHLSAYGSLVLQSRPRAKSQCGSALTGRTTRPISAPHRSSCRRSMSTSPPSATRRHWPRPRTCLSTAASRRRRGPGTSPTRRSR
jgi:transcriptional regulator with XRE-family HTH domain